MPTSPQSKYDYWQTADDIQAVVTHLKIRNPHILGCSNCALAAICYASKYKCASLTCIGLPSPVESEENRNSYEAVRTIRQSEETHHDESFEAILSLGFNSRRVEPIVELLQEYDSVFRMMTEEHLTLWNYHAYDPILSRTALTDEQVAAITCPVLLLHGQNDNVYDTAVSEAFRNRLLSTRPQAQPLEVQLEIIPGSPHWCTLYNPFLINMLLVDFLDRTTHGNLLSASRLSIDTLSPLPSPISAKRPLSPRDGSTFVIPPIAKLPAGVLTVGDIEKLYLAGKGLEELAIELKAERRPSAVHMRVEVVETDEEGEVILNESSTY